MLAIIFSPWATVSVTLKQEMYLILGKEVIFFLASVYRNKVDKVSNVPETKVTIKRKRIMKTD